MTKKNDELMSGLTWENLTGIPKLKKLLRRLNYSAILVLALGLALNRYVWKSYYLDAYAAGYVLLILVANYVIFSASMYGFYLAAKDWYGYEGKKDEEFDVFLNSFKDIEESE